MTHRDGFPWFSAGSAWRGDAGHRKPCAPANSHGPSESLGKPPFRSRGRTGSRRTGSRRIGAGVGTPRRCPAGPAASLRPARWPARWPARSPARSLWVIISEIWHKPRQSPARSGARAQGWWSIGSSAKCAISSAGSPPQGANERST